MIKNNPVEAALRLAGEFAGIPVLAPTQGLNGPVDKDSYYNDGVNKATVTAEQLETAFKSCRSKCSTIYQYESTVWCW